MLQFGIGCFHLGIRPEGPFDYVGKQYLEDIRNGLQALPSVANVIVDADPEFATDEDHLEKTSSLTEGDYPFPTPPLWLNVTFDIHIPARVQAEITRGASCSTDDFRVHMRYPYHFPVTFVELLHPQSLDAPSDGVQVVREFLARELTEARSSAIEFQFLGPSPFHADCYVDAIAQPPAAPAEAFTAKVARQPGYDRITFSYDQRLLGNDAVARDAVFDWVEDEFGLYYLIEHARRSEMKAWERIQQASSTLVRSYRRSGFRGWLGRLWPRSKAISDANMALAEFQSNGVFSEYGLEEAYSDMTSTRGRTPLTDYIETRLRSKIAYPVSDMKDLFAFAEARRTKRIDGLLVLTAALLGAGFASVLTYILTS